MDSKDERERKIIHRRLDGELNKTETKQFRRQIKTDPSIKLEYERLKKITDTSRQVIKPVPPPPDFKKRILDDLKKDE